MNNLIYIALLSIMPISELRGSIPLGFGLGLNPLLVILIAIIFNFLVVFLVFSFLDLFHNFLMRVRIYRILFARYIERNRKKLEAKIGTRAEFWTLLILVGIPLPFTGAYAGSILAWFFNLNRRKAYPAIFLGILIAAAIVTIISLGIFGIS